MEASSRTIIFWIAFKNGTKESSKQILLIQDEQKKINFEMMDGTLKEWNY